MIESDANMSSIFNYRQTIDTTWNMLLELPRSTKYFRGVPNLGPPVI
jgi:hypothetical protein